MFISSLLNKIYDDIIFKYTLFKITLSNVLIDVNLLKYYSFCLSHNAKTCLLQLVLFDYNGIMNSKNNYNQIGLIVKDMFWCCDQNNNKNKENSVNKKHEYIHFYHYHIFLLWTIQLLLSFILIDNAIGSIFVIFNKNKHEIIHVITLYKSLGIPKEIFNFN
jgi:hypothetical protein